MLLQLMNGGKLSRLNQFQRTSGGGSSGAIVWMVIGMVRRRRRRSGGLRSYRTNGIEIVTYSVSHVHGGGDEARIFHHEQWSIFLPGRGSSGRSFFLYIIMMVVVVVLVVLVVPCRVGMW